MNPSFCFLLTLMPSGVNRYRLFRTGATGPVHRATVIVGETCFVLEVNGQAPIPLGAVLDLLPRHVYVDLAFVPTDATCPVGRNQHPLAEPPVAGVDHQKADFPGLIVDEKIVDVTDRSVGSLDLISAEIPFAPQMHVTGQLGMPSGGLARPGRREPVWVGTPAPESRGPPVVGNSVVAGKISFVLAGDRLVHIDARAVPDFFQRQRQVEVAVRPLGLAEGGG